MGHTAFGLRGAARGRGPRPSPGPGPSQAVGRQKAEGVEKAEENSRVRAANPKKFIFSKTVVYGARGSQVVHHMSHVHMHMHMHTCHRCHMCQSLHRLLKKRPRRAPRTRGANAARLARSLTDSFSCALCMPPTSHGFIHGISAYSLL